MPFRYVWYVPPLGVDTYPALEDKRVPAGIGPTSVVRDRLIPNGGRIWRSCPTEGTMSDGIQTHGEG